MRATLAEATHDPKPSIAKRGIIGIALNRSSLLIERRLQAKQERVSNFLELSICVHRPRNTFRVNRFTLKTVAAIAWEKVHVQMRQRVSVDLIVHLHRPGRSDEGLGHSLGVPHECGSRCLWKVVQFDGMSARHEAYVTTDRH